MKSTTSKILLALVLVQTLVIMWLVFDRLEQNKIIQRVEIQLKDTNNEKGQVEEKLNNLLGEYENLKTNNAEVNAKLEKEKAKIEELLVKLRRVKGSNHAKIKELEQETETLRDILKTYIRQVDKLNTANKKLTAENQEIKGQYDDVVTENENIVNERDSLNQQVKKAAKLKAFSIGIEPLNKRQKTTKRARKVIRYRIKFNIDENVVAKKGSRNFYIRIAGPDNMVLMNKQSKMFKYNGKEIAYSAYREINYQGDVTSSEIYFTPEDKQAKGTYQVDIFADGKYIGKKSFTLK